MIQKNNLRERSEPKQDDIATSEQIRDFFNENSNLFNDPNRIMPAIVDGRFCLELMADVAVMQQTDIRHILDIGCGGGNATSLLLEKLKFNQRLRDKEKLDTELTLIDLSEKMLSLATERLQKQTRSQITTHSADIRDVVLPMEEFDVIIASLVLHHLRSEDQWLDVFYKLRASLKPNGVLIVFDLIDTSNPSVNELIKDLYSEYLVDVEGSEYRDFVFDHIQKEDTPRPLLWQLEQLYKVGFQEADILHKHLCYAAFYARR